MPDVHKRERDSGEPVTGRLCAGSGHETVLVFTKAYPKKSQTEEEIIRASRQGHLSVLRTCITKQTRDMRYTGHHVGPNRLPAFRRWDSA